MKNIVICLSIFVSISLGAMEEESLPLKNLDTNMPSSDSEHSIDNIRLANLTRLCRNSQSDYRYIVFIPSKLRLKLSGHYLAMSEGGRLDSFDEKIDSKNTYYVFYNDNGLVVEKDDTDNIVHEATRALTYYEHQWSTNEIPDFDQNISAYCLLKKVIDTHPEQINQPSLARASASYKAWEKQGQQRRHRIPFAHEMFELRMKNK